MRKISGFQIFVFFTILTATAFVSIWAAHQISSSLPVGMYEPLLTVFLSLTFIFTLSILNYRLFLMMFPLPIGPIPINSKYEFNYHVHLLFFLIVFHTVIRSQILPIPLIKLIYLGLGAKMGKNSFSSGIITDPMFVEIGDNCLLGHASGIHPHAIENENLSHNKIKIGNNVTIGTMAVVFSGVTIEDDAIVAAGAIVQKGTHIKRGEIWGGVPAKLISKRETTKLSA